MANRNPSPATRFKPGHSAPGGRPKESRDRITTRFLNVLADDFEKHGAKVVARVRVEDPGTYLRVYAGVIPKEIEISRPLDGMSDGELTAAIQALTELMRGQIQAAEPEPEQPTVN